MKTKTRVFGAVLTILAILIAGVANAQSSVPAKGDGGLAIINRSLSLSDALSIAQSSSLTLRQARADADSASAGARAAAAQTRPAIAATSFATLGDSGNIIASPSSVTPQNFMSVQPRGFAAQNIMIMAPLYTGGTLRNTQRSVSDQSDAARINEHASELTVRQTVTRAYVEALLTHALVEVAASRVAFEQEQVRTTQQKVNTGASAPVDLLREQAELADANRVKAASDSDAAQALLALNSALGISLLSTITPSDTLESLAAAADGANGPSTEQDAMRLAASKRPEVAAARLVQAAQDAVNASKGESSPQLYAVGMGGAMARDGTSSRAGYTVGLTASVPLYDGGQRKADVDAARAKLDRAQADALIARQQVMQQAGSAFLAFASAGSQLDAATAGLTSAQQAYTLADLRYNAGKSVAADRLDALSALVRAQGDVATAQAMVISARADLEAGVGGE